MISRAFSTRRSYITLKLMIGEQKTFEYPVSQVDLRVQHPYPMLVVTLAKLVTEHTVLSRCAGVIPTRWEAR